MKKLLILCISFMLMTASIIAQKSNAVKTDLLSPILRTGVIKFERALTEDMSLQLGFFYTGFTPRDSDARLSGYGITPEFRYYLGENPAPDGTYLAPNFRYMKLTVEDETAGGSGTLTVSGFGLNIGKQVLLKDLILIDGWFGPTYNFRSLSGDVDPGVPDVNGFGLRLGIAVGIAF